MSLVEIKELIKNWQLDKALEQLNTQIIQHAEAKILASTIFIQKGQYDQALKMAYDALDQGEEEENFTIQSKARMNISYTLWWLGKIQELDKFLIESDIIYHQIPEKEEKVRLYWKNFLNCGRGMVLWRQGKHDEALSDLQEAIHLSEQLEENQIRALSYYIIGLIFQSQGRLEKSEEILKHTLKLYQSLNSKIGIVYCTISLGMNYYNKGRLEVALDYFLEGLEIHNELGNKQYIAFSYDNIGMVYESLGEKEKAHTYLMKAIDLRREIGNDFDTSISLFNIVRHGMYHDDMKIAENSINELKLISEINNNPILELRYNIAQAIYFKELRRFNFIIKAKDIFRKILSERVINFELTICSMLHYCELLLMELRISEDQNVINEITGLLKSMQSMAELYQSYSILVEVMILQAKLSIVENEIEKAQSFLEQADIISRDMGLTYLQDKVANEMHELHSRFKEWKERLESNASILDKIEVSSIMDYLGTISTIDLNTNIPENYGEVLRVKQSDK